MGRATDLISRAYRVSLTLPPTMQSYAEQVGRCSTREGSGIGKGVVAARFGKNRAALLFNIADIIGPQV